MEEALTQTKDTQGADELSALSAHAQSIGVSFLAEPPIKIDKEIFSIISEDTAKRYKMIPFAKEKDTLSVAMIDPQDFDALNILRFLSEKEHITIDIYLTSQSVFDTLAKHYTGTDIALKEAIYSLKKDADEIMETTVEKKKDKDAEVFQDAPITKLVEVIVNHALDGRASDIHIEPVDGSFRVRFRIDGILRSQLVFPLEVGRAVMARIKILANLKIDEKRKPQDGRFRFEGENGHTVDLRVSSLPVIDGEKVVMRVLDKSSNLSDLDKLGLWGHNRSVLESRIRQPFGIILITGPTGSGKSTTLYAFLQILNQEERNIITLEDPVEYYLEGINQSQIMPEIGYTFASGLRSILRQDPNVIMVGEIRDGETAELTIHAALTGHLVFSTLHTNDAIGSVPRLVDMGVESFLLSSSLQAVAAQRLVRRICDNCRDEIVLTDTQKQNIRTLFDALPEKEIMDYGLDAKQPLIFFHGKGCDQCGQSGYKGRIAIYEVIAIDDMMRSVIADMKGNEAEVRKAAFHQGMITMKQDGILKALKGMTTLTEVERVTEGKLLVDAE
ncbi:MAG: GspE/PulE family protein [Minisyncoccota bacterium]